MRDWLIVAAVVIGVIDLLGLAVIAWSVHRQLKVVHQDVAALDERLYEGGL